MSASTRHQGVRRALACSRHIRSQSVRWRSYRPQAEMLESRQLLSGAGAASEILHEAYGQLPLTFEANQGQTDARVQYLSRGPGYTLFLTATEAVLALQKPAVPRPAADVASDRTDAREMRRSGESTTPTNTMANTSVLRMQLVGANPAPQVAAREELPGKVNYFLGTDSSRWRTGVPTYGRVEYRGVYPGIDLVYYGNQRQLEYDFVVAPGANPRSIALTFEGADRVVLDAGGELVLHVGGEQVRQHKPILYQEVNGVRREVAGGYVLTGPRHVGFHVADYESRRPLIIDPVLSYSTYLGANGIDVTRGVAVDAAGNAYVAGHTLSTNFPTTAGAFQTRPAGDYDVFVAKLNAAGSGLVYSTYVGGSRNDVGNGIAVDGTGNAYVTGWTVSTDFPRPNAFQPIFGGDQDAFVFQLNPAGSRLVYGSYVGGRRRDVGNAIAVDGAGSAYLTGGTHSDNFPTTEGAFQREFGGPSDAFVTKVNPTGTGLSYSFYLGGTGFRDFGDDEGHGIAVDRQGNAYVTGETSSGNPDLPYRTFPLVLPFQGQHGGNFYDAFVTKVNASGSGLLYSSFLGGNGYDYGRGITVDEDGNAYVTGESASPTFPTTPGAYQERPRGDRDAFVFKVSAVGGRLYGTFLGGRNRDAAWGIAVDRDGNAYVTGETASPSGDFPTNPCAVQGGHGGGVFDAFVAVLNGNGSRLRYFTFLGGDQEDYSWGIALDRDAAVYVTGSTASPDFPTTPGAFQTAYQRGGSDAFVTKLTTCGAATSFRVTPSAGSVTAGSPLTITVTALDAGGAVSTGYRGRVRFSSSDPQATLPGEYTFTTADNGVRTFSLTLRSAGQRTATVTDTSNSLIIGSAAVTVNPAAASTLIVASFPSTTTAGAVETFSVTARDPFGNLATGYRATVQFSSTDGQATLPQNYTFTGADNGSRTFGAVLKTTGTQSITVTDAADPTVTGSQTEIVITPAAASFFFVETPASVVALVPFDVTVYALDAYNNIATDYTGTVTFFSTTDPDAVLPSDYTFTSSDAGVASFPGGATLFSLGLQDLWASDLTKAIAGVSSVEVLPGTAPGGGDGSSGNPIGIVWIPVPALLALPQRIPSPFPLTEANPTPASAGATLGYARPRRADELDALFALGDSGDQPVRWFRDTGRLVCQDVREWPDLFWTHSPMPAEG